MTTSKEFDKEKVYGKDSADAILPQSISISNEVVETNGQPIIYKAEVQSQFKAVAKTAPRAKSFWQNLSLRSKATLLAVAIGIVPLMGVGVLADITAGDAAVESEYVEQKSRAANLRNLLTQFVTNKYQTVQALASTPFLTYPELETALTNQEKIKYFEQFLANGTESIVLIDAKTGDAVLEARTPEQKPTFPNFSQIDYFQFVTATKRPVIDPFRKSKTTGLSSFFIAAPVFNSTTGKLEYVVRIRIPGSYIDKLVQDSIASVSEEAGEAEPVKFLLTNEKGQVFAAENPEDIEKTLESIFPAVAKLRSFGQTDVVVDTSQTDREKYVVAYSSLKQTEELPIQDWSVVVAEPAEEVFEERQSLQFVLLASTFVAAFATAVIGALLARRATRPIVKSAQAVEKIGQGKFDTRLAVTGQDELATLGFNINQMAEQLQSLSKEQKEANRQQVAEAEQQRQQREELQRELLQLITSVEGASGGDLTVRAEISAGEIGIIADFFNAIIENLRELVNQIKQSATQVNSSVGSNESAIGALAEEAIGQANQITQTLNSVEQMALSIQEVANKAQAAATVARTASTTAETGGEAVDKTVESIMQLRETIAETAKKVKRLGESSQQISKAVSLINQIALKTNLLAVNASIEAARAGEEGRGFAVVAEEVGELAAQSATATKEIEQLVANIQRETSQVVEAMEQGTTEVVEGTRMVAQTKKSLEKIVDVSRQIDELLQSISNATVSQAQTSQSVTRLMEEIAQVSERTSDASRQISSSLQQTSAITQQLQDSVETFKVE